MDTRTAIKERILQLCEERHLTINKLAGLAAVSPSSLKNILYGKSLSPTVSTIQLLCEGLGVTLGEFFSSPLFDSLDKDHPTRRTVAKGTNAMMIQGSYILRNVAGSHVVVPVGDSVADFNGLITLNETGAFLWQQLQGDVSPEVLVERLTAEYDVTDEQAKKDVDAFLTKLRDNGFIG